jgi:hypothetical protein
MPIKTSDFSRTVFAETLIAAPPRIVWSVLVDLPRYGEWNPFAFQVASTLRVGEPIHMRVRMSRRWILNVVDEVRRVEPERLLCWGTCSPSAILYGDRYQILKPITPDVTLYRTWETYHGLFSAATMFLAPLLQRGFRQICVGLRTRCETFYRREEVVDGSASGRN